MTETPRFVGPHEGIELELMKAGKKPLSLFDTDEGCSPLFPEGEFDQLVSSGDLIKHTSSMAVQVQAGEIIRWTRVLYALPSHRWRIEAILHLFTVYSGLGGWRRDFERMIGSLLGYDSKDVEDWIAWGSMRWVKE